MTAKQLITRACAGSATALLAGVTLLAQAPGNPGSAPGQQAPQAPSQTSPTSPTSPGAQAPGAQPGTAPSAQSYGDQSFLAHAIEGSKGEVQLAQLAQQKSQSQDVKQLAQKLESDHTQMNQKWFEPLAKQMGASEPKGPSKKNKKLMEKLQGLSGDQFDKEYIAAMVKDHQKDLKEFKQESEATQDPNIKQVAQQGANILTQHLQLAEQVAKNHNVPVENKDKEVSSNK
jgi:putative membrane protein